MSHADLSEGNIPEKGKALMCILVCSRKGERNRKTGRKDGKKKMNLVYFISLTVRRFYKLLGKDI